MQADLHVHSRYSTRPSQWFLQKIGCPECFTEPLQAYHLARRRGMGLVTITDPTASKAPSRSPTCRAPS